MNAEIIGQAGCPVYPWVVITGLRRLIPPEADPLKTVITDDCNILDWMRNVSAPVFEG